MDHLPYILPRRYNNCHVRGRYKWNIRKARVGGLLIWRRNLSRYWLSEYVWGEVASGKSWSWLEPNAQPNSVVLFGYRMMICYWWYEKENSTVKGSLIGKYTYIRYLTWELMLRNTGVDKPINSDDAMCVSMFYSNACNSRNDVVSTNSRLWYLTQERPRWCNLLLRWICMFLTK